MTNSSPDDKKHQEHIDEEPSSEAIEPEASVEEDASIDEIPEEPGKTETLGRASDNTQIDKWIGRGLKLPPVEDDGHW